MFIEDIVDDVIKRMNETNVNILIWEDVVA